MRAVTLLLSVSLAACSSSSSSEPGTTDPIPLPTASAPDAGPTVTPCVPSQSCLVAGDNTFLSGGTQRTLTVMMPQTPNNAPVVFAWHYLNGSPAELIAWMQLQRLVDAGYLVVVPQARGLSETEWDVTTDPATNADVTLFDELRTALVDQHHVNQARIYSTGFSAGGLFTTFLTLHRAQVLAATAPFSGGVPEGVYRTPAATLPVLVSWGGPSDNLYGFNFDAASRALAADLLADGHEVVTCNHGLGHWLPDDAQPHVLAFFEDHGTDPSRTWSNAPDRIPDGCHGP